RWWTPGRNPDWRTAELDSSVQAAKRAACDGCKLRISTTCLDACARIWPRTTFLKQPGVGNHERTQDKNRYGGKPERADSYGTPGACGIHAPGRKTEGSSS